MNAPTNAKTTQAPEESILRNTGKLLDRASKIDPTAWASPLPARMQARRDRSYAQAVKEYRDG